MYDKLKNTWFFNLPLYFFWVAFISMQKGPFLFSTFIRKPLSSPLYKGIFSIQFGSTPISKNKIVSPIFQPIEIESTNFCEAHKSL